MSAGAATIGLPSILRIGASIYRNDGWERPAFRALVEALRARDHVFRGRTFVDVGANIGTQTLYAFKDGAFGAAIAVEPVPRNLVCLRANIAMNGFGDRVQIFAGAAGAAAGAVELGLSRTNAGAHSILAVEAETKIAASVDTVDAYLARSGVPADEVGMVWIDVEGFEPRVVEGASGVLAAGPPLVLEFNGATYDKAGAERFFELLSAHYDAVGVIRDGGVRFGPKAAVLLEVLSSRAVDLVWVNPA